MFLNFSLKHIYIQTANTTGNVIFVTTAYNKVTSVYSKSKLELESNLSEILPVNCKFIYNSTPTYSNETQT